MNNILLFSLIYVAGVLISAVAQILLKKAANVKHESVIKEYLNLRTISAYAVFFAATLCSLFAYKYIPLSMGPILGTTEYLFVAILSLVFLKEKLNKKKIIGLIIVLLGVVIFSIR